MTRLVGVTVLGSRPSVMNRSGFFLGPDRGLTTDELGLHSMLDGLTPICRKVENSGWR
jgi:hypothetical protein